MAPQTPIQENLIKKNEEYSSKFTSGALALPPAKKYAILTCMDARIDPASAYGIDLGDAHVIRNAGANAKDALRSLVVSQQLLGTQEVILIKHTGCGMLTFDNDTAAGLVEKNLGAEAVEATKTAFGGDFQAFPGDVLELEEAVKKDVELLRDTPLIKKEIVITGWVYEVETGKVRQVI